MPDSISDDSSNPPEQPIVFVAPTCVAVDSTVDFAVRVMPGKRKRKKKNKQKLTRLRSHKKA